MTIVFFTGLCDPIYSKRKIYIITLNIIYNMKDSIKKIFHFGEKVRGYDIRVLNEREARAAAGIMFFFAIIAFMNAWLVGNFEIIKLVVVTFLIDFFIRVFINPKYSPTLVLGRLATKNQKPEYTGAPQKRFAWGLGFALASIMFYLVVINNVRGPINLSICSLCLILLFFETSFGICIGCKMYSLFNKPKLCPGGVCEIKIKEKIQKINYAQIIITILFLALIIFFALSGTLETISVKNRNSELSLQEDCEAPEWAIKMGHEELYKLHHGCE